MGTYQKKLSENDKKDIFKEINKGSKRRSIHCPNCRLKIEYYGKKVEVIPTCKPV